jgi:hypothetical protein
MSKSTSSMPSLVLVVMCVSIDPRAPLWYRQPTYDGDRADHHEPHR